MKKDWIITVVLGVLILIGLGASGFYKISKKEAAATPSSEASVAGAEAAANYFSQDAKIMYFYSDYCHWCQQEKTVLTELGNDGYKVKPMNVGETPELWEKYKIEGTPTFIAENGDRLVGYQEKAPLKSWFDSHK